MKKFNFFHTTRLVLLPLIIYFQSNCLIAQCDFIDGVQYSGGSSQACACQWVSSSIVHCSWGNCSVANQSECQVDCAGDWFLGSANAGAVFCSIVILPTGVEDFYGYSSKSDIELFWITSSEVNNDRFEVYHSSDLNSFEKLTEVEGVGNSDEETKYRFVHRDAEKGIHYYQLTQVDFNGTESVTNIVSIEHNGGLEAISQFSEVYPNPASDVCYFSYYGSETTTPTHISMFNLSGELLQEETLESIHSYMGIPISLEGLEKGVYVIRLIQGTHTEIKRVSVF